MRFAPAAIPGGQAFARIVLLCAALGAAAPSFAQSWDDIAARARGAIGADELRKRVEVTEY